jgi:hypothetical protein
MYSTKLDKNSRSRQSINIIIIKLLYNLLLIGSIWLCITHAALAAEEKLWEKDPSVIIGRKFDIKYDSSNKITGFVARDYLRRLDKATKDVERILKYEPQERITLLLVPKSKFVHVLKSPVWSAGTYRNYEITLPFEDGSRAKIEDTEKLDRILRHEYAHALIMEQSINKCPLWLNEGLAQMVEGNAPFGLALYFKNWLKTNKPLSIRELSLTPMNLGDQAATIFYAQSLFMTKYLVKKYGMLKIRFFLQNLNNSASPEEIFRSTFYIKPEKFDTDIARALANWMVSEEDL